MVFSGPLCIWYSPNKIHCHSNLKIQANICNATSHIAVRAVGTQVLLLIETVSDDVMHSKLGNLKIGFCKSTRKCCKVQKYKFDAVVYAEVTTGVEVFYLRFYGIDCDFLKYFTYCVGRNLAAFELS